VATSRRSSISSSSGDVLRTVAVLVGVLAVVALAINTFMRPDLPERETVDYAGALDRVRSDYPYPVLAPASLPDGWRATSVSHSADDAGNRWRLGFLIGDHGYVGLEQTDGEVMSYLADRLVDFSDDGVSIVAGERWERRLQTRPPADRALVRVEAGVATIVRGTEPYQVLEQFAASLEP
jgi:hypothetical protein